MNFNTTLAVFLHVTAQRRGFGCPVESISFLAHVQHAYTKLLTAYEKQQPVAVHAGPQHAMNALAVLNGGATTGQRRRTGSGCRLAFDFSWKELGIVSSRYDIYLVCI